MQVKAHIGADGRQHAATSLGVYIEQAMGMEPLKRRPSPKRAAGQLPPQQPASPPSRQQTVAAASAPAAAADPPPLPSSLEEAVQAFQLAALELAVAARSGRSEVAELDALAGQVEASLGRVRLHWRR